MCDTQIYLDLMQDGLRGPDAARAAGVERLPPSSMKHSSFDKYRREDTERGEAAMLTIWPKLADFHEDPVLVGGLVPRYLCRQDLAEGDWQPRTLDVDLAIALVRCHGSPFTKSW